MTSIRPYIKSDASRCCDIINECVNMMSGLNKAARELIRSKNVADVLDSELSSTYCLVAEHQHRVVGLSSLADNEIKRVYVDPDSQGAGVGRALIKALEAEAARQGVSEVITESSPNAQDFYLSLGYDTIEPIHYKRGDAKFFCFKMSKQLHAKIS